MCDFEPVKLVSDPAQMTPEQRGQRRDQVRAGKAAHRLTLSPGVFDLGRDLRNAIIHAVRNFNGFTPEKDPAGEHGQGTLEHRGIRIRWAVELIHVPDDGTYTYMAERAQLTIQLASEIEGP